MFLPKLVELGKKEEGFTLVELLIVVAIIAILAAIAIPQFSAYRKRGYAATMNSDIKNVFTAAQAYIADNPAGTAGCVEAISAGYKKSDALITCAGSISATAGSFGLGAPTTWSVTDPVITFEGVMTKSSAS